jgi:transposase
MISLTISGVGSIFDKEIETVFRQSEACQRIARVKGIGPKTATAVVAAIGKGTEFKNGRHFAAWLGLVPRQHSVVTDRC